MAYAKDNRVSDSKSDRYKMVALVLHERNRDSIYQGAVEVWWKQELRTVSISDCDIQIGGSMNPTQQIVEEISTMSNPRAMIEPYPIANLPKCWQEWVKFMGCGRARDARIAWLSDGFAGKGWYVWCGEYPEEGGQFLGRKTPKGVRIYQ